VQQVVQDSEELLEPQVDVVPEDQQDVPAQLVCLERLVPQVVLELRDGEVSKDQLVKKESKDHQESKAWEDQRDQLDQLDSKDHLAEMDQKEEVERLVPQEPMEPQDTQEREADPERLVFQDPQEHEDHQDHQDQPLTPSPANTSQKCCHSSERSSLRRAHLRRVSQWDTSN